MSRNLLKRHTKEKFIKSSSMQVSFITFLMSKFTLRIKFLLITDDFHSHLSSNSRKLLDSLAKMMDGTL